MAACLKSLFLVNVSDTIISVASVVREVSEGDKDGEFSEIIHFCLSCTCMQPKQLAELSSLPLRIAHELRLHGLR
jgi:hypothetical protein